MSVLSQGRNTSSASTSVAKSKNAKEATMSEARCKIKVIAGHRDDGVEFKGWYLGVLTAEKARLSDAEKKTLLSHFWARPANEAGEYEERTSLRFYPSDKHDGVMRAWYWLADVDMVTKEEVQKWTAFLGKPAKRMTVKSGGKADEIVAVAKPAKKVTKKVAPAKKVAKPATKTVEWAI